MKIVMSGKLKLSDLNLDIKKDDDPLEIKIENKSVRYAKKFGWKSYKFKTPGQRSVPDRLFARFDSELFLVEFKRKGKQPTEKQMEKITEFREMGFKVYVVDNFDKFKRIIDRRK